MECNKKPQADCRLPECIYVNATRKYCRKANNTRRVLKEMSLKLPKTHTSVPKQVITSIQRKQATKKIARFIKTSNRFLQVVCEDSGQCMSFGNKVHEIVNYFNGFTDFKHAENCIVSIGDVSSNGFVRQLKYSKNGYTAYAVLKSAADIDTDNLVYEYVVGIKFVNRVIQQFPCFVYTYGLFFYKSFRDYLTMRDEVDTISGSNFLPKSLVLQKEIDYKKACSQSRYASILIQNLNKVDSFGDALSDNTGNFIKYQLTNVLFIIYHALSTLSKVFTHYDLHRGNVLIFRPYKETTIQYVYHMTGSKTIMFKCPFIPKLIDYGRCFFDNGNVTSKSVYQKICSIPECGKCGQDYGFTNLSPTEFYGISVQKKNESHDLRLVYELDKLVKFINIGMRESDYRKAYSYKKLEKVIQKVKYGETLSTSKKSYGTPEDTTLHPKGNVVANVTDMFNELKKIVSHPDVMKENMAHPLNVAGIFHVYEDGRSMEFIKE